MSNSADSIRAKLRQLHSWWTDAAKLQNSVDGTRRVTGDVLHAHALVLENELVEQLSGNIGVPNHKERDLGNGMFVCLYHDGMLRLRTYDNRVMYLSTETYQKLVQFACIVHHPQLTLNAMNGKIDL